MNGEIDKKRKFVIVILLFLAILIAQSSIMKFSLGRVFDTSQTGATSARASGYKTFSVLTPVQLVWGTGYGNYITENTYGLDVPYRYVNYSSLAEYLFTTGIIGTLLLIHFLGVRFCHGVFLVKVLLGIVALLSLSGSPLTGSFFPIYLSLCFCDTNNASKV